MTGRTYRVRCTDGEERSLGDFGAGSLDEATTMALRWAGADGVLEWSSWDLVDAATGVVVARYSAAAGVSVLLAAPDR
ncbi:MAG: hypothetical protein JWN84_2318 [Nocardioides sp.]|nr:hypothetical protein [Nocardioides sp.]